MSGGSALRGSAESIGRDGARFLRCGVEVVRCRAGGTSSRDARFRECKSTVSRNVIAAS